MKWLLSFLFIFLFSILPIQNQIQLIRFHLLENQYNKIATQLVTELQNKEDTQLATYTIDSSNFYLTTDYKNIYYMKKESA